MSRAEIDRLQRIIDAYEKLTLYSREELLEADRMLEAHERVQDLSREEMKRLYREIDELKTGDIPLEERIKTILSEDTNNETAILQELEALRRSSGEDFYSDLFRVLVHYDFSAEEALEHWENILKHREMMSSSLERRVSFRTAMLDYFIDRNRILRSPKVIEISLFDEVMRSSLTDELTGLYNRRYFDRSLAREVNRANRHNHEFALVLFDVDDFKQYNDRHGHAAGDEILSYVGKILKESMRDEDTACRYGGEEFIAILPETGAEKAALVARRVVERMGAHVFAHGHVTISAGIAAYPKHATDPGELFLHADRALYAAKASGKNRVVTA